MNWLKFTIVEKTAPVQFGSTFAPDNSLWKWNRWLINNVYTIAIKWIRGKKNDYKNTVVLYLLQKFVVLSN